MVVCREHGLLSTNNQKQWPKNPKPQNPLNLDPDTETKTTLYLRTLNPASVLNSHQSNP